MVTKSVDMARTAFQLWSHASSHNGSLTTFYHEIYQEVVVRLGNIDSDKRDMVKGVGTLHQHNFQPTEKSRFQLEEAMNHPGVKPTSLS